jgi:hypothetical protein
LLEREEFLQTVVQDKWIQARIALADIAVQRLVNRVGLHLALGGIFGEDTRL